MSSTREPHLPQSDFEYDYDTLRTTGVILAVIMFVAGILIALSGAQWKFYSRKRQKCRLRLYKRRAGAGGREELPICRDAPERRRRSPGRWQPSVHPDTQTGPRDLLINISSLAKTGKLCQLVNFNSLYGTLS